MHHIIGYPIGAGAYSQILYKPNAITNRIPPEISPSITETNETPFTNELQKSILTDNLQTSGLFSPETPQLPTNRIPAPSFIDTTFESLALTLEGAFDAGKRVANQLVESAQHFAGTLSDNFDSIPFKQKLGFTAITASTLLIGCNLSPDLSQALKNAFIQAFGGLGIFFLGMKMMSDGLENAAEGKLQKIIQKCTDNVLLGTTVGAGLTAIIQSSSALSMMVISAIQARIMTLRQGISLMFGANIGTTMTGILLSLKASSLALPLIGVGVLANQFLPDKKVILKNAGLALAGLGAVFLGMKFMSAGFKDTVIKEALSTFFSTMSGNNHWEIFLCIFSGTVATAVVQSSSATLGIVLALTKAGVINFNTAAALVFGLNIGTVITAFLAVARPGTSVEARRLAASHLLFNTLGTAMLFPIAPFYISSFHDISTYLGIDNPVKQVAAFHLGFNALATTCFLPMINYFQRFVEWILPDKNIEDDPFGMSALHESLLVTPDIAVLASHKVMTSLSLPLVTSYADLEKFLIGKSGEDIQAAIDEIRALEEGSDEVKKRLKKWGKDAVPPELRDLFDQQIITAGLEGIFDGPKRIIKALLSLYANDISIPDESRESMLNVHNATVEFVLHVNTLLHSRDLSEISDDTKADIRLNIARERITIRKLINSHKENHNLRLSGDNGSNKAHIAVNIKFIEIMDLYEQIARRAKNIADALIGKRTINNKSLLQKS
ncbi:MAG: Na/Pi symporter [Pseudomonadota bacterium]